MELLLINSFIKENSNLEQITKKLFEKGIMTKHYQEDNLLLIYNNFNTYHKSPLVSECRSVVIDLNTNNIITYTGNTPIYNYEGYSYLIRNKDVPMQIYECYEGTMITLFYHNEKWYISTRRCLNAQKSVWNNTTHYDMFTDVLEKEGLTFDNFTDSLDKSLSYYFVLVHHSNKNIVDYTKKFGENYSKLIIVDIRKKEDLKSVNLETFNGIRENIIYPIKFDNIEDFDKDNLDFDLTNPPESEGIIIKLDTKEKNMLIKLQNFKYQFYKSIGPEKHLYRGFINLYQKDKLLDFLKSNDNSLKYQKIINPLNNSESFDIIGCVDALFRIVTNELYNIFFKLWDEEGQQKENDFYIDLPKIYKEFLFGLRGIYFKRKSLKIGNIYSFLKNLETEKLITFLRNRKLFSNWAKHENKKSLLEINSGSNKVHLKLTAIYSNKLFPEIVKTDFHK